MTFINQILYPNKKFDSPESLALFEPFIYKPFRVETEKKREPIKSVQIAVEPVINMVNPVSIDKTTDKINNTNPNQTPNPNPNQNLISPTQTDTLFWCIYIATYGYLDYISIGTKYKNKEIEIKQQMIKTIQTTPNLLRPNAMDGHTYKITKVATQEIMSELMLDQKTSLKTLYAMCIINKLSVYLVDENTKTYLKYGKDEVGKDEVGKDEVGKDEVGKDDNDHGPILIRRSIDGIYFIDLDTTHEKIENIKETLFEIEHGPKPIKPISSYKMADLEKMTEILDITFDSEKVKKQEMYDKILNQCIWITDTVKKGSSKKRIP
jgi:hypothetical protein